MEGDTNGIRYRYKVEYIHGVGNTRNKIHIWRGTHTEADTHGGGHTEGDPRRGTHRGDIRKGTHIKRDICRGGQTWGRNKLKVTHTEVDTYGGGFIQRGIHEEGQEDTRRVTYTEGDTMEVNTHEDRHIEVDIYRRDTNGGEHTRS